MNCGRRVVKRDARLRRTMERKTIEPWMSSTMSESVVTQLTVPLLPMSSRVTRLWISHVGLGLASGLAPVEIANTESRRGCGDTKSSYRRMFYFHSNHSPTTFEASGPTKTADTRPLPRSFSLPCQISPSIFRSFQIETRSLQIGGATLPKTRANQNLRVGAILDRNSGTILVVFVRLTMFVSSRRWRRIAVWTKRGARPATPRLSSDGASTGFGHNST